MRKIFILLFMIAAISLAAKNKTWTCINENGETVFTVKAIRVYDFHSGLARVYKNTLVNNKWITGYGFVNSKGEIVIDCNLKDAKDFYGDVTWVKLSGDEHYTLINKKGKVIPTKKYKKVGYTYASQPDMFAVYEEDRMGFIKASGKEVIPCKYIGSEVFTEGLASVCHYDSQHGDYGFINKKGEEVIPLKFRQGGTSSFKNGMARAKVGGRTVLIDKTGKTVFKTLKGNIQGNAHGLVRVFTKSNRTGWGWLNLKDQFIIKPVYDDAEDFNKHGYAIVEKGGLTGLIDTTGKVVLDFKYKTIYADYEEDGFYLGVYPEKDYKSLMDSKKDYYDANLQLINTTEFYHIMPSKSGKLMKYYDTNQKIGYLNRQFEVVIKAKYSRAEAFSEGMAWVIETL